MDNQVSQQATKQSAYRRFLYWLGLALAATLFGTLLILLISSVFGRAGQVAPTAAGNAPAPEHTPEWTVAPTPTLLPANPSRAGSGFDEDDLPTIAQSPTNTPVQLSPTTTPTPVADFTPDPANPKIIRVIGAASPLSMGSTLLVFDANNELQARTQPGSWCTRIYYNDCLTNELAPALLTKRESRSDQFKVYYFLTTGADDCALFTTDFGSAEAALQSVQQPAAFPAETRTPDEIAGAMLEDLGTTHPFILLLIIADPDKCGLDAGSLDTLRQQGVSVRIISLRGTDEAFKEDLRRVSSYYLDAGDDGNALAAATQNPFAPGYAIRDAAGTTVGQGLVGDDGVEVQPNEPFTVVVELASEEKYPNVVVSEEHGAIIDLGTQ